MTKQKIDWSFQQALWLSPVEVGADESHSAG